MVWLPVALALATPVHGLQMSSRYSPRNAERPLRQATRYIILHTTEGPTAGSLDKVRRNGECHYFVTPQGDVYRIVERSRVAYHAGRSMWEGKTDLDRYAVGIEVVGFHNKDLTASQYTALRELLQQLQQIYRVTDERVIPHSMVAYGAPNRWHKHSHRGRKRCGMCFAEPAVRARLGLTTQPLFDPDVKAGRLVVADPYLESVLFGSVRERERALQHFTSPESNIISPSRSAWDIARDLYNRSATVYVFPDGTRKRGDEIQDWTAMPAGTRVLLQESQTGDNEGEEGDTAAAAVPATGSAVQAVTADRAALATTIYLLPDGRVRAGNELADAERTNLPENTRVLIGYVQGGYITAKRSAFDICGERWNRADTLYRLTDGSLLPGNQVRENSIPPNTSVFFKE